MNIKVECNQCGKCCRVNWKINLSIKDIKKLNSLGYSTDYFTEIYKGIAILKKNKLKECLFLKNNLCSIQGDYGYKYKPEVCKRFPYNDPVCGIIKLDKTKTKKIKFHQYALFFTIEEKSISVKSFNESIKNFNPKKSLFEEYCRFLTILSKQKEKIILEKLKSNSDINIPKKLKRRAEFPLLRKHSRSPFPSLNKLLNKKIKVVLPTQNFEFSLKETKVPEKANRQFINFLVKNLEKKQNINYDYPVKLLTFLYFLPYFAKELAGEKEINFVNLAQAFSLLNGLNRFGEF